MCKPAPSTSTVLEKAEAIDNSKTTEYSLISIPLHGPTATLIISVLLGLLLLFAFYKMCVNWKKSRRGMPGGSRAYTGMPNMQIPVQIPMPMVSYPQHLSMPMEAQRSPLGQQQGQSGYTGQQLQTRFSHAHASAPAFQNGSAEPLYQTLTKAASDTTPDGHHCVWMQTLCCHQNDTNHCLKTLQVIAIVVMKMLQMVDIMAWKCYKPLPLLSWKCYKWLPLLLENLTNYRHHCIVWKCYKWLPWLHECARFFCFPIACCLFVAWVKPEFSDF